PVAEEAGAQEDLGDRHGAERRDDEQHAAQEPVPVEAGRDHHPGEVVHDARDPLDEAHEDDVGPVAVELPEIPVRRPPDAPEQRPLAPLPERGRAPARQAGGGRADPEPAGVRPSGAARGDVHGDRHEREDDAHHEEEELRRARDAAHGLDAHVVVARHDPQDQHADDERDGPEPQAHEPRAADEVRRDGAHSPPVGGGLERAALRGAAPGGGHRASARSASVPSPGRPVRVRCTNGSWTGTAPTSGPASTAAARSSSANVPNSVTWAVPPSRWRASTSRPAACRSTTSAGPVRLTPRARTSSAFSASSTRPWSMITTSSNSRSTSVMRWLDSRTVRGCSA